MRQNKHCLLYGPAWVRSKI